VLKAADLVQTEKRGTTVLYRLNTTVFQDVLTGLLGLFGEPDTHLKGENRP